MSMLLVLNEPSPGAHDDVHRALARLVAGDELEDARVIAHAARRDAGVPDHAIGEEVLTTAAEMKASFVVWSHTGRLAIADELLTRLKTLPSRPVLAYWDNDMYQRFHKPFPAAALRVARRCDVVFVCGASAYVDHLHRHGCRDIRYTPSSTDEERFGLVQECDSGAFSGDLDVVLVGNRVTSRVPLRTMPGARERERLVALFARMLGARFAVYGHGWTGSGARGPLPFLEQGKAYRSARVALGNNSLHAAYYFSNRLPICMSSGRLMVHNREFGFERVFGPGTPLNLYRTPEEAWDLARRLLEHDESELRELQEAARSVALERFTMFHVQRYIVRALSALWRARSGVAALVPVENPWLTRERLR